MSAKRTQIYLTAQQRSRIDELAASEGLTMAEVIRRALDAYLAEEHPDPAAALRLTFGVSPETGAPSRDEWARG